MREHSPTLVVDAGGTLITRTRAVLTSRVLHAIHSAGGTTVPESVVRQAVLTSRDVNACLRALDLLDPAVRSAVAAVLADDPGDAVVLPDAEKLLQTATELGWRTVLATNAGPGTPALPERLTRYLTGIVDSRACGLVKEDPRFWAHLLRHERVDPLTTLVVGDDEVADRQAPASAGLQSRRLVAGENGLAALAADLRAAGPSPPDAVAVVAGDREYWAGRDLVSAPHLQPLVTRVTRARVRFISGSTSGTTVVVRRRGWPPAVISERSPLPGVAWLLQAQQRPSYAVPAELERLLEGRGLSLTTLSPSERRHALSMIWEARSDETVAERIADLVDFLEERREGDVSS